MVLLKWKISWNFFRILEHFDRCYSLITLDQNAYTSIRECISNKKFRE